MTDYSPVILIDKPYISDLLIKTIKDLNIPAFLCNKDFSFSGEDIPPFISEEQLINTLKEANLIYLNSENAISYLLSHTLNTNLIEKTELLKNKLKFREMTKDIYPDFNFKGIKIDNLKNLKEQDLIFPFILKPSVGFFSMNVYKINNFDEYQDIVKNIGPEAQKAELLYPKHVIDTNEFIIEEYLDGEEFAIDAYYDIEGKPVILNILKHLFYSEEDTSDRIYYTHKDIINQYLDLFQQELEKLGKSFNLRLYPVHVEFRILNDGRIFPIEINPLRFAGWCTSELIQFAFGLNPYEYFFKQKKPCWEEIFRGKENKYYSINVADIPNNVSTQDIVRVDYEQFLNLFSKVLEVRKLDYKEYPVFAFVFAETQDFEEMIHFLKADLTKYLIIDNKSMYQSKHITTVKS